MGGQGRDNSPMGSWPEAVDRPMLRITASSTQREGEGGPNSHHLENSET